MGLELERSDDGLLRIALDDLPFAVRTERQVRQAVLKVLPVCSNDLRASCEEAIGSDAPRFMRALFGQRRPGVIGDGDGRFRVWYRCGDAILTDPVLFSDPDTACSVASGMADGRRAQSAYVESEDGDIVLDTLDSDNGDIWLAFGPLVYHEGLSKEEAMAYVLMGMRGMSADEAARKAAHLRGYPMDRADMQTNWTLAKNKAASGMRKVRKNRIGPMRVKRCRPTEPASAK